MKYMFFFATPSDIVPALRCFEANAPLKFVDPNIKATPNRAIDLDALQIPEPGLSTSESERVLKRILFRIVRQKMLLRISLIEKGHVGG